MIKLNHEECIKVFERFNISEKEITDLMLDVCEMEDGETVSFLVRGKEVQVTEKYELTYKEGKRFPLLENAIKQYIGV